MLGSKKPEKALELYDLPYRPAEFSAPFLEMEKAFKQGNHFKVRRCLNVLFPEIPLKMLQNKLNEGRKIKEFDTEARNRLDKKIAEFQKLPNKIQNIDISIINGIMSNLLNSTKPTDKAEWQALYIALEK